MSPTPGADGCPRGVAIGECPPAACPVLRAARPAPENGRRGFGSRAGSLAAALAAGLLAFPAARAGDEAEAARPPPGDARIAAAWRTLRAVDCARCHGGDYEGLAAPSIVAYARTQSREMFMRMILDGDPARGMPGYRDNPRILETIEDTYLYFLGRARGAIGMRPLPTAESPGGRLAAEELP